MINLSKWLPALALGVLSLSVVGQQDTSVTSKPDTTDNVYRQRMGAYTVTGDELDADLGTQDISGILQSSRDVFTSTAGFNFGAARFRIRGYDSENTLVSLNGVLINDLETGWPTWSLWGGLNDVTRWMQVRTGIVPSRYNFGGIGGFTEIDLRASQLRPGLRVSYASANRTYRNRLMATYSTGMMKNGWAITAAGSRRWSDEGFVEGTPYNAYSYFLSAEKRINARHSISFSGMGAWQYQGRQGLAVQEAYDLSGSSYYNPFWGYQNGEKRNARMSNDHKPILLLSHVFTLDSTSKLTTSLLYTFGRDGLTNLNWFDAKDPRPDYYRYLPSFYQETDPGYAAELTNSWNNGPGSRQIDWDELYFANSKNLYTVQNANGTVGNSITGNRSKYIVEDQRADPVRFTANTVYSKDLDATRHLTLGGSVNMQRTHYFKVVEDLLGGDYFLDLDNFADRDFGDSTLSQNDLQVTNKVVGEGDVFGYDYLIHTHLYNVFGQFEKKWTKWEAYGGLSLSYTSFWREGNFVNGRFPENSLGDSEKQDFLTYGLKGGVVRKLSGRHYLTANVAYMTRPPAPRYSYLSPRTRDVIVPGLTDEKVFGTDLNYLLRFAKLKGRATLYYSRISDQVWARSFYHDEFQTIVNYTMTGVDQVHMGVELGLEANLTSTWTMTAVYAWGSYRYDSRPNATITRDNSNEPFASDRTVYWENYYVGGMPQTAASLGFRYNSPKYWFAGVNANYFGGIYLDPNPDRRTTEALGNFVVDDPQWDELLDQTKLDDNYTMDVFVGKSWMVNDYRIALNLSVNNILNNQDFRIGGYEQSRYDRTNVNKFPPKYSYMYGTTYFAMLTFSF